MSQATDVIEKRITLYEGDLQTATRKQELDSYWTDVVHHARAMISELKTVLFLVKEAECDTKR